MHRSEQDGVTSRHEFSAGAVYDPSNVSFGPVVGLDEHVVAPGAGFDWHAHRGVVIVSVVLDGTLRHESSAGEVLVVGAGESLVQATGDGIRHTETNASTTAALRFVQVTVLDDGAAGTRVDGSPVSAAGVHVSVRPGGFDGSGTAALVRTADGDVVRVAAGECVRVDGPVLVVELTGASETRR